MRKIENASEPIRLVFSDNAQYENFQCLCVDSVTGDSEYSAKEANEKILSAMWSVMGLPEYPTEKEVRKAMKFTAKREAMFEIVSETIEDTLVSGWEATPFFQRYVEVRNMNLGQKNEFYIPDTTELIVSKVSGSNHDLTRQRLGAGSVVSVDTAYYGAKFYVESVRFLMGLENWANLIAKLSNAFTRRINTMLNDSVMGAVSSLPNATQWGITGALTAVNKSKM